MIISTNLSAIFTNEQLSRTTNKLSKSMEKLSSGYRINSSADDAVGMALSEKFRLQLRGLERGKMNTQDGVSVVETAEGALAEINDMVTRLRELSVQAANGLYMEEDRENIQQEVEQLKEEINRIARDTQFNGITLMDGSVQRNNYCYGADNKFTKSVDLLYFSDQTESGKYKLSCATKTDADGKKLIDEASIMLQKRDLDDPTVTEDINGLNYRVEDNTIRISGPNDFAMEFSVDDLDADLSDLTIEIRDAGGMIIQVSEEQGKKITFTIPEVSTKTLKIDTLDITTEEGAAKAIRQMDEALERVVSIRGKLGAIQNRFERTISSINVSDEAINRSLSAVMDTDMAAEMTEYTSLNVVQQAGISMLTQANQQPEKVLQLLQY